MRLALAAIALVVAAGPGWADVKGVRVLSAAFAPQIPSQPPEVLVTIENASEKTVAVTMTCAAIKDDTLEDVMPAVVSRVQAHDKGYTSAIFPHRPALNDVVKCEINDVINLP